MVFRLKGHLKDKHAIKCPVSSCEHLSETYETLETHLKRHHIQKYEILVLVKPEEIQSWLKDNNILYGPKQAF